MGIYRPVRALERGLAVLRAANTLAVPTVDAIAKDTGLAWSTTFRMLETLEMAGFVRRNENARTFRPTLQSRGLGDGVVPDVWIAQIASPAIGALSRNLVWPVDLMVFSADAMLIVETTHRTSPLSIDRNMIGRRLPVLLTSAGCCYLGHVKASQRRAILTRLARKQDEEGDLARQKREVDAMLAKVARTGYGRREGGLFPHTRSISVPIMRGREVAACISIIWIASAMPIGEGARRFLQPLRECAGTIGGELEAKSP